MTRVYKCPECLGKTYVSDGQPEDGMMTGRMQCPTCRGFGWLTVEEMMAKIEWLLSLGQDA